jgi:hypothetical protein
LPGRAARAPDLLERSDRRAVPSGWASGARLPACCDAPGERGPQVKDLNLEEGGAFTVSSADEILSAL